MWACRKVAANDAIDGPFDVRDRSGHSNVIDRNLDALSIP
jgi:hypothetical protein